MTLLNVIGWFGFYSRLITSPSVPSQGWSSPNLNPGSATSPTPLSLHGHFGIAFAAPMSYFTAFRLLAFQRVQHVTKKAICKPTHFSTLFKLCHSSQRWCLPGKIVLSQAPTKTMLYVSIQFFLSVFSNDLKHFIYCVNYLNFHSNVIIVSLSTQWKKICSIL